MAVTDVGIDLGTSSILVYVRGRGVVLKEPSVAAYDRDEDKIRAIGEEARVQLSPILWKMESLRTMWSRSRCFAPLSRKQWDAFHFVSPVYASAFLWG